MSEAVSVDAPAQAAAIASAEVQHPIEVDDAAKVEEPPKAAVAVNTNTEVKPEEIIREVAAQVEPEIRPAVKLDIEEPKLDGKSEEETQALLAKAAKQGTSPLPPIYSD